MKEASLAFRHIPFFAFDWLPQVCVTFTENNYKGYIPTKSYSDRRILLSPSPWEPIDTIDCYQIEILFVQSLQTVLFVKRLKSFLASVPTSASFSDAEFVQHPLQHWGHRIRWEASPSSLWSLVLLSEREIHRVIPSRHAASPQQQMG